MQTIGFARRKYFYIGISTLTPISTCQTFKADGSNAHR
jgi:hypothetical protein